jgi:hypothetical protein
MPTMDPGTYQEEKSGLPVAFLVGIVIVTLLVVGAYFLTRGQSSGPAAEAPLPMAAAEQAYAPSIRFADIQMARATNFLNQELTYVGGTLNNDGTRKISTMEVTIEFHDQFGQVILRDTRRLPDPRETPIAPGEHREFQFSFEHIPVEWNRQYPVIRVTGLVFG